VEPESAVDPATCGPFQFFHRRIGNMFKILFLLLSSVHRPISWVGVSLGFRENAGAQHLCIISTNRTARFDVSSWSALVGRLADVQSTIGHLIADEGRQVSW